MSALGADRRNPLTDGYLCGKVRHFAEHVYHPLRLRSPMIRLSASRKGQPDFRAATWDEALDLVCERMRDAVRRSGGEAILPFAYGGSNGKLTDGSVDEALWRRLGASRLLKTVCREDRAAEPHRADPVQVARPRQRLGDADDRCERRHRCVLEGCALQFLEPS